MLHKTHIFNSLIITYSFSLSSKLSPLSFLVWVHGHEVRMLAFWSCDPLGLNLTMFHLWLFNNTRMWRWFQGTSKKCPKILALCTKLIRGTCLEAVDRCAYMTWQVIVTECLNISTFCKLYICQIMQPETMVHLA